MDSYDAIIYGNDIHSLITALLILKNEKRVLLVNQNDRVGNFTEYYQRRRFTFNNIYNTLSFASEDNNDMINRLIKELNTNTNFLSDDKLHHIISINRDSNIKKEYLLPMGIDKFIEKVDEYIPGSKDSVTDFFSLAEECHSAIEYIIQKRENAGLSITGLANKTNIKLEILEDIESGKELFLSVTQRQQIARVLKVSPKELKEYERSYEFQEISDDVIENLKTQILNHKTDLRCPLCGEPLVTKKTKMYDLDDNLVLQPKAHCVKCVFQIKD